MTPSISTLRLWQLISPSLPVGGYSYSQGLEPAIDAGVLRGEADVGDWIGSGLRLALATTDLPVLLRIHSAWARRQPEVARIWCERLIAMRETAELRFGDLSMGAALARLLRGLGLDAPEWPLPFAGAFAVAAAEWSIAAEDACAAYAWSWCESQVAAAVKLVPLGHTAGQRLLLALGEAVVNATAEAQATDDDDIGFSLPGVSIASAQHEIQYSRLFRS